jgi:hypothetical protein
VYYDRHGEASAEGGSRCAVMHGPIDDQMVDLYQNLFGFIFSEPIRGLISQRLKRNVMIRQVEEAADAASQSLTRFLSSDQLTDHVRGQDNCCEIGDS